MNTSIGATEASIVSLQRSEEAARADDLFLRKSERRFHDVLVPSAGDIALRTKEREVNAYIDPVVVRFLDPKPSDRRALSPYEHERALARLQEMTAPALQSGESEQKDLARQLHSFFAAERELLRVFETNRIAVIPC